jgi:aspartate/methionine/tyrosine aminotransferase
LVAGDISEAYGANIEPANVLITAGCNQAFCLAASALADTGDEIILPVPYYFNHQMWLQINHIVPQHIMVGDNFIPDPNRIGDHISSKTRAIVLVTPGNPTGRAIPLGILNAFANIARRADLTLIIDETYRHFGQVDRRPHDLFSQPDWPEWAVFLYSFSKEFAIPGYRVGAAVGHPDLVREMMKIMDCVAICAPRVGQEAAIAALTKCKNWRREKAAEIFARQSAFEGLFARNPGNFVLQSVGAFFGWVKHPFAGQSATSVAQGLVSEQGVIALPGSIFSPDDDSHLRMSFGGLIASDIEELGHRLSAFGTAGHSKK